MSEQNKTPAAEWREAGKADPHGSSYDCDRECLTLGKLSDDALANALFMNYDVRPPISAVIAGEAFMPIVYATAAKERIRWLSRKVVAAEKECAMLRAQLANKA